MHHQQGATARLFLNRFLPSMSSWTFVQSKLISNTKMYSKYVYCQFNHHHSKSRHKELLCMWQKGYITLENIILILTKLMIFTEYQLRVIHSCVVNDKLDILLLFWPDSESFGKWCLEKCKIFFDMTTLSFA